MLYNLIASSAAGELVLAWIEVAAWAIEILAVAIIVIVRTVALEATLQSVLVLGLLVLIRTFLSWALVVEIEGHWPWQAESET